MQRMVKASGLALAAVVAAAALPAAAQDQGDRQEGHHGDGRGASSAPPQAPAPQPRPAAPAMQQRQAWDARRAAQAQGDQQAQAQARQAQAQRAWQARGQGGERAPWDGASPDRAAAQRAWQADHDRQQAYRQGVQRDPRVDAPRDQRERDQAYRQGWQGGERNGASRDQRDRDQAYRQGWRDNQRSGYAGNDRFDRGRHPGNGARWNRDWRRDNRYDWGAYRNQHRNIYRAGRYYAPYHNWSYRRLNVGFFLEPLFYGSSFWINDPYYYRLPAAYGPYRWVRYYDDALLVDTYSGEVVDVIYDFFW